MTGATPRTASMADLTSLSELMPGVFGKPLVQEFPSLFDPSNLSNCRVVEVDGRIVTYAGMLFDTVSVFGCGLKVACVGAVATDEAFRMRGYAGACFKELVQLAAESGCDFMMVSGSRSLYLRAGCRRVGLDFEVEMTSGRAGELGHGGVEIRRATVDDIPTMDAFLRRECVHWQRRGTTWAEVFDERTWAVQWSWQIWVASQGDADCAYFAVDAPSDAERAARITEIAGDRDVALRAFAAFVRDERRGGAVWKVSGADDQSLRAAGAIGLVVTPATSLGTILVVNLPQMMRRLRPYLAERVGDANADALAFAEDADGATVSFNDETLSLPTAPCVAQFLFGTREDRLTPPPRGGGLADLYAAAFPVPFPEYGLNLV